MSEDDENGETQAEDKTGNLLHRTPNRLWDLHRSPFWPGWKLSASTTTSMHVSNGLTHFEQDETDETIVRRTYRSTILVRSFGKFSSQIKTESGAITVPMIERSIK